MGCKLMNHSRKLNLVEYKKLIDRATILTSVHAASSSRLMFDGYRNMWQVLHSGWLKFDP